MEALSGAAGLFGLFEADGKFADCMSISRVEKVGFATSNRVGFSLELPIWRLTGHRSFLLFKFHHTGGQQSSPLTPRPLSPIEIVRLLPQRSLDGSPSAFEGRGGPRPLPRPSKTLGMPPAQ